VCFLEAVEIRIPLALVFVRRYAESLCTPPVEKVQLYITDNDSEQKSKEHGEKVRYEDSHSEKARGQYSGTDVLWITRIKEVV
jgi:hypothetical protein